MSIRRGRDEGPRDGRFFYVPRRDIATLRSLVQSHIAPGSEVHSDQWRAYTNYIHETVNHSENFIDPTTRAHTHTQGIERTWRDLKQMILREKNHVSQENIEEYLKGQGVAKR